MQIRRRLFLSNVMMFLVPLFAILIVAGALYSAYQDARLDALGNTTVDKQAVHAVETDIRDTVRALPSGMRALNDDETWEGLAARMDSMGYHLLVMTDARDIIYSNCTELDMDLLGAEMEPVAFEADSAVYIFRSINVVKYMFQHEGLSYHAIGILSRDVGVGENKLYYIYHSYIGLLILVGLLAFLVVSIVLVRRLATKILRPLDALQRGARAIEEGDLSYRLPVTGDEEFAALARHFNGMTARLEASRAERLAYEQDRKLLLAGISHDIRTPLTVIKGYIEGLRDGVAGSEAMRARYIAKIYERTQQLDALVDRLFLYSKMNLREYPFHFQPIDIVAWLGTAVEHWQKTWVNPGEQLRLEIVQGAVENVASVVENDGGAAESADSAGGAVLLSIDTVELDRALMNILTNARKYKQDAEPLAVAVTLTISASEVVLRLTDNGAGVPEAELSRLFGEFYRGDSARTATAKGSGLGLAIVKKIIEAHKGEVWAENEKGGGLAVVIVLPRVTEG